MSFDLRDLARRRLSLAAVPLIALLIGVVVAIASNPTSLRERGVGVHTARPETSATPVAASPVPTVTSPGMLGDGARLLAGGPGVLVGLAPNLAVESGDSGKTWTSVRPPSSGSGIAIDPADTHNAITGGSSVQVTTNGGVNWKTTRTSPPAPGPYQPIQVSPFDGAVWFLTHQEKLLRTRDASLSWRDLSGLPPLSSPVMSAGTVFGQFFLATGNRVFELIDNGQRILELPALPPAVMVTDLAVVAGDPPTALARTAKDGVYLFKDNKWSTTGVPLKGPVSGKANGVLVVGNGGAKLGSHGAISYSTDAGATWSSATGLPYDQSVEAISGQPSSTILFAYCYGGDLYTSADSGRSWTLLTRGLRTNTG